MARNIYTISDFEEKLLLKQKKTCEYVKMHKKFLKCGKVLAKNQINFKECR